MIDTVTQARGPSTMQLYALKWCLFINWCYSRGKTLGDVVLNQCFPSFQEDLDSHLSLSTLKLYVAAIVANYDNVDGRSVGNHLIIEFLKGVQRLNHQRLCLISSWDLSVVLWALQRYV